MPGRILYEFSAVIWQHPSPGGWHFISLPKEMAKEIRMLLGHREEGWGRLAATARLGDQTWDTAIWYDKKQGTYLLPVRGEVRKKANLSLGQSIPLSIWI